MTTANHVATRVYTAVNDLLTAVHGHSSATQAEYLARRILLALAHVAERHEVLERTVVAFFAEALEKEAKKELKYLRRG